MVGNWTDAAQALEDFNRHIFDNVLSWEGTTRCVFLINGVVYKVQWRDADHDNLAEYRHGLSYRPLVPANVHIPDMTIYWIGETPVLAMEYIDGSPSGECIDEYVGTECSHDGKCMSNKLISDLTEMGWYDATFGNAIVRNGEYYLIDIGT